MKKFPQYRGQRGIVMLTALIMMVLILLVAISSFKMGSQNAVIAGNMQHRAEAVSTANQAVEQVISSADFIANPSAALPGNQVQYDINGDGTDDITVTLSPAPCVKKAQVIKNIDLNVNDSSDASCLVGAAQNLGVEGAVTGDSLCSNSIWEINAVATDNVTDASVTVTTGVGVRVAADDAKNPANECP